MPLVVVCHGLAAPGLDRQPGLGAVERLDLAFFIDRQHHRMGRRIDIEPNNISELVGKLGSRLKVRSRCGCGLCACQMRCVDPSEMPMALAIAGPVQ